LLLSWWLLLLLLFLFLFLLLLLLLLLLLFFIQLSHYIPIVSLLKLPIPIVGLPFTSGPSDSGRTTTGNTRARQSTVHVRAIALEINMAGVKLPERRVSGNGGELVLVNFECLGIKISLCISNLQYWSFS
jgi:hypothetical protein